MTEAVIVEPVLTENVTPVVEEDKPVTLHDRIFKEFLERFLPEFMRIFFPEEAARLDFSTVTFLRQELVITLPGQVMRITDVVAEVKTLAGEPETIIVHVEVEANRPKPVPQRMFDYYALLRILRKTHVLPIALILKRGVGGLKWRLYTEDLFGRKLIQFRYGQVGLRDLHSADYLPIGNPIAATLATFMKPGEQSNAEVKLQALQTVVDSNLTDSDKLFLINVVETYLPKVEVFDAREEVMQALQDVELTWGERLLREGEEKGMHKLLLLQLTYKFGELPQEFVNRLYAITDHERLAALSAQVLTVRTLDEITLTTEK
ncbi:MAG: hypothetical protein R3E79_03285 [Caldilineaceae bacterium]